MYLWKWMVMQGQQMMVWSLLEVVESYNHLRTKEIQRIRDNFKYNDFPKAIAENIFSVNLLCVSIVEIYTVIYRFVFEYIGIMTIDLIMSLRNTLKFFFQFLKLITNMPTTEYRF